LNAPEADTPAPSPAPVLEFDSAMTPLLLTQVLAGSMLTTPLALTIMLAGPLFLLLGALTRGAMLLQWGYTFLMALPAVPLVSFAIGYLNAFGKASKPLYEPLHVRADAAGLELGIGEETRVAEWSEFSRWRRMLGTHLLYATTRTFLVLRTDGLDAASREQFESLLRANIPVGPRR
jgi:hypothetical protein